MSLGALVHRLDPGIVPFRKATECQIHVSGGEYNAPPTSRIALASKPPLSPPWWIIPSAT